MKIFIFFCLLMSFASANAGSETLLTGASAQFSDKYVLLSQDCSTAYTINNSFSLDEGGSKFTKASQRTQIGADKIVANYVHAKLIFNLIGAEITDAFKSEVLRWANQKDVGCNTSSLVFSPYPSLFVQAAPNFNVRLPGLSISDIDLQVDGSLSVVVDIAIGKIKKK